MNTPQLIDSSIIQDSPKPGFVQLLRLFITLVLATLLGCSATSLEDISRINQLQKGTLRTGGFKLMTLGRPLPQQVDHLRVYLGSDGRPWEQDQPSADPSGNRALAVELMVQDPLPAIYIGRPCYHMGAEEPPCEPSLWTSARYSQVVVDSLVAAIEELVARHRVHRLSIVGYSGGGTLALLVAPQLDASLKLTVITVAGNLDPQAWTGFHGFLPLADSLNPVDVVPPAASFRQVILLGDKDPLLPPQLAQRYLDRQPGASVIAFPEFDHVCCWVEQWPAILRERILPSTLPSIPPPVRPVAPP